MGERTHEQPLGDLTEMRDEMMERAQKAMGGAVEFAQEKPHVAVAVALGVGWLLGNGLSPRLVMTVARLGSKALIGGALASTGLASMLRAATGIELPAAQATANSAPAAKKRTTKSHTASAIKT